MDPSSIFSTGGIGFRNYGHFSNKRVDELIAQGAGKPMDEAMSIWKEYQKIMHEVQPYTIIYEAPGLNACRKKFENVESNALDVWFNLDEWFIPKGKQLATK